MSRDFRIDDIQSVEFAVCHDTSKGERYYQIPVDKGVQDALKDMLKNTIETLHSGENQMETYEPAQKYASTECLEIGLDNEHMEKLKQIYKTENIVTNAEMIKDTKGMAFYFAIYRDTKKNKLVAIRRAAHFKGILKAQKRLISLIDDTLRLVEDEIFKLDNDFDYLIFDQRISILHPSGFEYTSGIETMISNSVACMIEETATRVTCIDFLYLKEFASSHKRAARLIASLRARPDLHLTSSAKLQKRCKDNGIEIVYEGGKLRPLPGSELPFLEMLDRRRYMVDLVDDQEELYIAANRRGVQQQHT